MQFLSDLLEHPSLFAYFSGANNYTWLQFRNGDRRLLAKPLTYFEERLPSFIRVHKTVLINPVFIATVLPPPRPKMPGLVRMQDGAELPVSRRRWTEVGQQLLNQAGHTATLPVATPGIRAVASLRMLVVMTGNALLLTRERVERFGPHCQIQSVELGGALATDLLQRPMHKNPSLILLDARTNRADRSLTLRSLKSHPKLQNIPVIWLASPDDDPDHPYTLGANSVVQIPDDPKLFGQAIEQLCRYWLLVAQPVLAIG
ncbi:response regulator transcription factor [Rudanella lutea]|uniref:response regulator transcription factor n=1 Tax=Rudanella lutea TaxID=451374 RepID=UPI00035E3718|nr:LytTR family transcriptional regulator DNA-binding domain-containing protein [Rudanella lutea]